MIRQITHLLHLFASGNLYGTPCNRLDLLDTKLGTELSRFNDNLPINIVAKEYVTLHQTECSVFIFDENEWATLNHLTGRASVLSLILTVGTSGHEQNHEQSKHVPPGSSTREQRKAESVLSATQL